MLIVILRSLQGAHLYSGDNLSLFCFVPEDTIQMSILVLVLSSQSRHQNSVKSCKEKTGLAYHDVSLPE